MRAIVAFFVFVVVVAAQARAADPEAPLWLAAGYKARWVALALAAFTLVASFGFHAFWDLPAAQQRMQYIHFWKNMSIAGGMLMVFALGPGRLALDRG